MIYLDATAIDCWLRCREEYRRRYIENIVPRDPNIHIAFGHAEHTAVEAWHKGESYEMALYRAAVELEKSGNEFTGRLNPKLELKWRELGLALPDCVAAYCDAVEPEPEAEIEQEWKVEYSESITLAGKIDRYGYGVLTDVKTASEIGATWKHDYREMLLRTFQFGLYDWYLRVRDAHKGDEPEREGVSPQAIKVECIVKPYRGRPARFELFDLPEITVYRKRFDQQLDFILFEIQRYHDRYLTVKPWPMASSQICQGKFSSCDYLPLCNGGDSPKLMEKYGERKEHLVCLQK